jgi:hypothetical protein
MTIAKITFPLCLLLALTGLAGAQNNNQDNNQGNQGKLDKKDDAPKSPWSVTTVNRDYGNTGTSTTVIKKDVGDGWSVGGQMSTPYADRTIGGSGAPGLQQQFESPKSNTIFGPYLEKKF